MKALRILTCVTLVAGLSSLVTAEPIASMALLQGGGGGGGGSGGQGGSGPGGSQGTGSQGTGSQGTGGQTGQRPGAQAGQGTTRGQTAGQQQNRLMRASNDVVGQSLVGGANEQLGRVEDLIIHPRGDIAYVEFSGASSLNTGARRFPVPYRALSRNQQGQFTLGTSARDFTSMPGFDKDTPALSDAAYWNTVDRAYDKVITDRLSRDQVGTMEASAAKLAPAKTLYSASDLRARAIETPDGQKLGTVREIVVDPRVGRVSYVVLALNGQTGTTGSTGGAQGGATGSAGTTGTTTSTGKLVAVPWDALRPMPDRDDPKTERWTLSTTPEKLAGAPAFQSTAEGWTSASNPDYVQRVYQHFNTPLYYQPDRNGDRGGMNDRNGGTNDRNDSRNGGKSPDRSGGSNDEPKQN